MILSKKSFGSVELAVIVILVCSIGAILSGYGLLKIYDEFYKALTTKSRARLMLACSMAMFVLIVTIFTFTVFGVTVQQNLSNKNSQMKPEFQITTATLPES